MGNQKGDKKEKGKGRGEKYKRTREGKEREKKNRRIKRLPLELKYACVELC